MPSTYTPIATQTLGSAAASVTFSSISGTYTDLVLIVNGSNTASASYYMQFNGDTGSNYSYTTVSGNGSSAVSARSSNNTKIYLHYAGPFAANTLFMNTVSIQNYSNATTNKSTLIRASIASDESTARVGLWRSTAAITSILVSTDASTFKAGSTFTLYGIKAA
jgi:hypothetical protein